MRKAPPQQAFTLLEVILLVAILALLLVLLFSSFSAISARSKTVKCTQHLRQIGLAFHQHSIDHNGLMPYYRPNGSPNPTWRAHINPYLHWVDDLSPGSPRYCAFHPTLHGTNSFSYLINHYLSAPFWRLSEVAAPSRGLLVACREIQQGDRISLLSTQSEGSDARVGYHHQQSKATILFIDGHVELLANLPGPDRKGSPEWNAFWNPTQ